MTYLMTSEGYEKYTTTMSGIDLVGFGCWFRPVDLYQFVRNWAFSSCTWMTLINLINDIKGGLYIAYNLTSCCIRGYSIYTFYFRKLNSKIVKTQFTSKSGILKAKILGWSCGALILENVEV